MHDNPWPPAINKTAAVLLPNSEIVLSTFLPRAVGPSAPGPQLVQSKKWRMAEGGPNYSYSYSYSFSYSYSEA